jgi:predicted transglutaminase-like cysteine proteinase
MGGFPKAWQPLLAAAVMLVAATAQTVPAQANRSMATGDLTSQPIGHYEYCQRLPAECSIRLADRGPMALGADLKALIARVNLQVNRAVMPLSDLEIYGRDEFWTYPVDGVGDCEDYALEKRRLLREAGLSLTNLLITVVRKSDGEGHAVLTVRTDRGDYILDNLNDEVKLWSETNYQFLKRQASTHTGRWVNLREENNMLVSAIPAQ